MPSYQIAILPCAHKAQSLREFPKKAEYNPNFVGFKVREMREGDHV